MKKKEKGEGDVAGEEKRKINKEGKQRKEGGGENRQRVNKEREKKEKKSFPLLSKIYGDQAVGFRRSKR